MIEMINGASQIEMINGASQIEMLNGANQIEIYDDLMMKLHGLQHLPHSYMCEQFDEGWMWILLRLEQMNLKESRSNNNNHEMETINLNSTMTLPDPIGQAAVVFHDKDVVPFLLLIPDQGLWQRQQQLHYQEELPDSTCVRSNSVLQKSWH